MTKVLLISHDIVGPRMAGPGIRAVALAKTLSSYCAVRLAAPDPSESIPELLVQLYHHDSWHSLSSFFEDVDVVIINGDTLTEFPEIADTACYVVIDSYDPHTAENLMWQKNTETTQSERWQSYNIRREMLLTQCRTGDFFLCASEVQRDWLLGLLESHGRLNPWTLDDDPSFRRLIDIVPYGLPSEPFNYGPEAVAGIAPGDKVLLWGGGVWPWLDALTAVRALPRVLERFPTTRLLFPGTRHPNPAVPAVRSVDELKALTRQMGLDSGSVLFGDWVSRGQWPAYLARADVGLSLHPDTIETHLAFRSRLFEYVWAGLPMVVTGGDATSAIVTSYDLGYVTPYKDTDAVADAIITVLEKTKDTYAANFEAARANMTWEKAAEPLVRYCQAPYHAADHNAVALRAIRHHESVDTEEIRRLTSQRDNLLALVKRYEQGRFMQVMRWLKQLKNRILRQ